MSLVCGSRMEHGKARLDTVPFRDEREWLLGMSPGWREYRREARWRTGP
jgi:hypothetical protein